MAVCPWIDSSSFAPKAPPLATSVISTSFGSRFSSLAICSVVVYRTLAVGVDAHTVSHGKRQARLGLEERDLDRLRLEGRLDDVRRRRECRIDVSARERRRRLQNIRRPRCERLRGVDQRCTGLQCLERIGERLENLVVDPDLRGGLSSVKLRVGDNHRQEVGDAAGQLAFGDEDRLVRIVQALSAEPGDVGGREDADDAWHLRGFIDVDLHDARPRMLGQHHRAMQHPGDTHVVDEVLVAEGLLGAAQSRDRVPDALALAVALSVPVREGGVSRQAELLAEEGMPTRFGACDLIAARSGLSRGLNRVDDAPIPGAAAEMPVERLGDHRAIAGLSLLHQGRGTHDDARDAEATLDAALEDEGVAHPLAYVLGQAFERHDRAPFGLLRFSQARQGRRAVDQHEAAAAGAFRGAPVLGRDDAALLAQDLEQIHPGLVGGGGLFPVQREADLSWLDSLSC